MRLIRVMCSGRVDLEFILRAFYNGLDGVFIGGCRLDECNYVTKGNYDALALTYIGKQLMRHIGLNPDRLRTEFMSGAEGQKLAEVTDEFSMQVKGLGPLGHSERLDRSVLRFRIDAARRLVPFIRLLERERLRVPEKSQKAYHDFFTSAETQRLLDTVLAEKLAISQIMLLLGKTSLSMAEISQRLGLNPSDTTRYLNLSSRLGLVRYNPATHQYGHAIGQ